MFVTLPVGSFNVVAHKCLFWQWLEMPACSTWGHQSFRNFYNAVGLWRSLANINSHISRAFCWWHKTGHSDISILFLFWEAQTSSFTWKCSQVSSDHWIGSVVVVASNLPEVHTESIWPQRKGSPQAWDLFREPRELFCVYLMATKTDWNQMK